MKKKTFLSHMLFVFFILILLIPLSSVSAIDITTGSNDSEESSEDNTQPVTNEDGQPLVTILLYETDLREAIKEISLQTGVNIIADQTVSGTVTADLEGVPLEKALRIILISGGYTFRKIDDFYFIGLPDTQSRTFDELSELEIVELQYITVEKLLDVLPASLEDFVEGNRQGDTITINAAPRHAEKIMEIIKQIDKPQQQVEVKVLVTQIDSRYIEEYGADLFNFNDSAESNNELGYDVRSNLLVLQTDIYGELLSRIKLLNEEKKATIEADPRILLTEGETAELFIGDRQVLLLSSQDDDIASRIERVQVGVALDVTAQRVNDDSILLNIAPQVSHFIDEERPDLIIKESSVDTTVSLKNGQTIALAGMTMTDNSSTSKQVPGLSNIPLLRWLFTSEKMEENETELMIFVTPVIR
ncbi:MAG: type II secretion system protein GspD [Halanaerobiales bacterium]